MRVGRANGIVGDGGNQSGRRVRERCGIAERIDDAGELALGVISEVSDARRSAAIRRRACDGQ